MEENCERFAEDDPRHHTIRIRDMLNEVRDHLREDIGKINEPRAEALFETTAEALDGLYNRLRRLRARARGGLAGRCLGTFCENAFRTPSCRAWVCSKVTYYAIYDLAKWAAWQGCPPRASDRG